LPISVGVARTKHLAKIASQVAKPDGLVVVDPKAELDFLHPLNVTEKLKESPRMLAPDAKRHAVARADVDQSRPNHECL
jgi:nucleotidyltransferase/DNA polymerase involved in DNA repair